MKLEFQYVMISLFWVLLLLIFLNRLSENGKEEFVIQIQMPYPDCYTIESKSSLHFSFKKGFLNDSISYNIIELSGVDEMDKTILAYTEIMAKRLVDKTIPLDGICLKFSEQSKFWTLVEALDICNRNNVKVYALANDCLWMRNPNLKLSGMKLPSFINCGTHEISNALKSL